MIMRALIFLCCLLAGLWSSTYLMIARIGTAAIPESAYLSIFGLKFATPWLWAKWFYIYGGRFSSAFQNTLWPIYVSILVGIAFAWLSRLFINGKKASTAHGSSRWAQEKEIKASGLLQEHGVVLGQSQNSSAIMRHNGPEHVLVIAPTRGGKGVGLVIPTLLDWQESVVIFDPKGENWQITSGYRSSLGPCLCFDPTSKNTARFNPLMEIRKGELEVKDAQNIADIIVDPDGRLESRNHWQNAAHSLLVGTILHVLYAYERKSLAGLIEFLTRPNSSFEKALDDMLNSKHPVVNSVAQEMLNKHVEERSGVLSTAISLISIFRDPMVAHATDGHDFAIDSLKKSARPVSLYLVLPPSDISRLRVLLRLMLNQMGRVLTEKQEISPQRVLFLLDEFPALGRLDFFESALAYIAGYGLKALLICQSLNQLQKAYGERNAILDNCHVRVAFANNDDQTARRLSNLLGEQTLSKEQTSVSGGRFDMFKRNASVSQIEFARPLMLPSEINRLPQNQELILVNGMYPILADKLRYYDDKRYQAKVLAPMKLERQAAKLAITQINEPVSAVVSPQAIGSAL